MAGEEKEGVLEVLVSQMSEQGHYHISSNTLQAGLLL
jgi:hypothetical protein